MTRAVPSAWLALALVVLVPGAASAHPPSSAADYAWVDPPPSLDVPSGAAEGRRAGVTAEIVSSGAVDVWTPDLQAVLSLAVPPDARTPVEVVLTPVAPADLPPVPGPLVPNGNAYRVELTGADWTPTGTVLHLTTPFPAATAWRLDGEEWVDLDVAAEVDGRVQAPVEAGDVVLAAADRTDGHGSWWAAFSHDPVRPWVAGVALLLLAVGLVRRRLRAGP